MMIGDKVFLRNVVGEYMISLGDLDDRVLLINADLMRTCRNEGFAKRFPERSFNVGIAEQNMVSFAAGLAHEGFIPFAFSMAPFLSMRACEQCRTDVAYGKLKVRLMATYAGVSGGISGATHWGMEDCAIMCAIPEMTVVELSDPIQARRAMRASLEFDGPVYFRSGVESAREIYRDDYCFSFEEASVAREGTDGAFVCSGVVVQYALSAAESIYQTTGKEVRVVDMHTIKPIDRAALIEAAETKAVVIAQDHSISGGLGQTAAAVIAEEGLSPRLRILGIPDAFFAMAHAPYLYKKFGYDREGLEKAMLDLLN